MPKTKVLPDGKRAQGEVFFQKLAKGKRRLLCKGETERPTNTPVNLISGQQGQVLSFLLNFLGQFLRIQHGERMGRKSEQGNFLGGIGPKGSRLLDQRLVTKVDSIEISNDQVSVFLKGHGGGYLQKE
jgi:hypothetical protein